jgi:hypothetical protein
MEPIMALSRPTFARLQEIMRRQNVMRWGADYLPAIQATPKEAPSGSRASILTVLKLAGREMHLLSPAERALALLAIHHPFVVDIHEQAMLSPDPCPHPLFGFPGMAIPDLASFKGVIDVAERLGYTNLLPLVWEDAPSDPENPLAFVFPYIGDLLLFLSPPGETPYCVNWNIKNSEEGFKHPGAPNSKRYRISNAVAELPRNEMERVYYADAGIRTEHLTLEQIDTHVVANLTQLFTHHAVPLGLSTDMEEELLARFQTALETGVAPYEVVQLSAARGRCTVHQARTYLWQAIWRRELRCNLFRPLLIDRPLQPENQDVLDVYGDWFRRG